MKHFVLSLFTMLLSCSAWAYDFWLDGIYYNFNSDGESVSITNGSTPNSFAYYTGDVVIPSSVIYNNKLYAVTGIDTRTFAYSQLTSVTIPESVTSIGDEAFYPTSGLTSITLPKSIKKIGNHVFNGCTGKIVINCDYPSDGQQFYGAQFSEVVFGDDVETIGDYVCKSIGEYLKSVSIGKNVKTIGKEAFRHCTSLISVTIPNSVTSIGEYAFYGCTGLSSLSIGDGVETIGSYAFYDCWSITSIEMGSGINDIGESAFYGCKGLTSVTIPNSVTSIGDDAFKGCSALKSVSLNSNAIASATYTSSDNIKSIFGTQVREYVIGNDVASIGNYAFYGCSKLTSITIPNSVTSIGNSAFSGCSGLISVNVGDGVTSIGNQAFSGCYDLESVYIGRSVTSIGDYVFDNCTSLTSVTLNSNNLVSKAYTSSNNIKSFFGDQVKDYVIGEDVTSIGDYAFYRCSGLASVTIGNNVTSIGSSAFGYCFALTSVTIPNSVTSIGEWAFQSCRALTSVTIPNSVTTIGNRAFYCCDGLTSVDIGDGVTSIGESAFSVCTALTSVNVGNGVKSIGADAFYLCIGLTSITIPESVTSMGGGAFSECSALTSVNLNTNSLVSKAYTSSNNIKSFFGDQVKEYVIGEGVTGIGDYAFAGCSSLTSITIPQSVTIIGSNAFYNCSGLMSITIPKKVTTIGSSAFYDCSGLIKAEFANIESLCRISFDDSRSNPLYYAHRLYIEGQEVKDIVISNSVTSIGDYVFSNCSNLTSICIPNSVTSIGDDAFKGCSSLEFVTCMAGSVPIIGSSAFYGVPQSSATLYVPESSVNAYKAADQWKEFRDIKEIPVIKFVDANVKALCVANWDTSGDGELSMSEAAAVTSLNQVFEDNNDIVSFDELQYFTGLTSIGNSDFFGCTGLTSLTIGDGVETIDFFAFEGCSGLTSIEIPNSVTSIGGYAFSGCTGLTSVKIPNSVTSLGNWAFGGCSGLTSVEISNSVTSISTCAFADCTGLTSVKIPNGVTNLGTWAFSGCSSLTSVEIPNSVTSIDAYAFNECTNLTSITCEATTPPTCGGSVFYNVDKTACTLYVPAASVEAYKAADTWKEFGRIKPTGDGRIYIESDLTSQFPTDWKGWNGATGYTSTTFAPMVTTNDGRNVQVCERFNGSIATVGTVFTRKLTGLTNGIYRIELYGAASSTKGRDTAIDSEMTAEDEGDETVVYLYAQTASGIVKQYIPVHWATSFSEVATAVLNEVEVTDGTVEIGMYSDKKYTNWHVVQIKGVTALVDAEELHNDVLQTAQNCLADDAYANIVGEERTILAQTVDDYSTVLEPSATAYKTAVDAIVSATNVFDDAKESYDIWAQIKEHQFPYASLEKKTAAETAANIIPTNAADALIKAESMKPLYRQYAESSALMEGVTDATDMTSIIDNPKAEVRIADSAWQIVRGVNSGGSINILENQPWTDGEGNTAHRYFDGGQWGASAWDVSVIQDITLPAGRYQLSVMGRSSDGVEQTLFVDDNRVSMPRHNDVGALFNNGWEQTSIEFELSNESTVSIGVQGVASAIHGWMSFSDFRLVQFPESVTNINDFESDASSDSGVAKSYFDMNGREIPKPQKGMNIVKYANGKVNKIFVK